MSRLVQGIAEALQKDAEALRKAEGMTFTKKEREAIRAATSLHYATTLTLFSEAEQMFWHNLLVKLDAWAALHGEGDAAIQRARKRNAARVKERLTKIGAKAKASPR